MIPPAIVKIPGERVDQLKRIAEKHNLSLADAIGLLINQEIAAGRLSDELTGLEVKILRNGKVVLSILGIGDILMDRKSALQFAVSLENAADRKRGGILDLDAGISVVGIGPAVRLRAVESDASRVLAPSIARDFARQIRRAAEKD